MSVCFFRVSLGYYGTDANNVNVNKDQFQGVMTVYKSYTLDDISFASRSNDIYVNTLDNRFDSHGGHPERDH